MAGNNFRGGFSSSSEVAQWMENDNDAGHTGDSVEVELDQRVERGGDSSEVTGRGDGWTCGGWGSGLGV
jgi:hypothetical protein